MERCKPVCTPPLLAAALAAIVILGAPICAAQTFVPGYPDNVYDADAREMAMLPAYCKYSQAFRDRVPGANNPAEIGRWYSAMGDTFHHVHHYCAGLIKTNRAVVLRRTGQYRKFYLRDAIIEYDYVITRAPAQFVLLPEILTKKGENLIRLGQGALAVRELERAIELKPDYWPPYAALSDYYGKKGDDAKARDLLQKALSFAPDAKGLQRRLAELENRK